MAAITPEKLPVSIGRLAQVEIDLVQLASSGQIVETAADDIWDLAFIPVDDERKRFVDFGQTFYVGESTYLVRDASAFHSAAELDSAGARICGIANTATIRSAEKAAPRAQVIHAATMTEAVDLFIAAGCDAIAMGRLGLKALLAEVPGSRLVQGNFHVAETALAMPKHKSERLEKYSAFLRELLCSGFVASSFSVHGMADATLPKPDEET